jgi:peptide/nickel transport system permease protein
VNYLGRRLVRAILLLVGVSALCFAFTEMAPGSFFDEMRLNPQISPATITSLEEHYGLNQPLFVRYERWMQAAAHGDFGYSIAYNTPVAPLLWSRAKNTLLLTIVAMLLAWLISVPLGVWAAAQHGRMLDKMTGVTSSLFLAVPEVVFAVALLAIVVRWRILPFGGMKSADFDGLSTWARFWDVAGHMLLPVLILALADGTIIFRHVRASVLEALEAPFVRASRSFGISRTRLLFRHVLPVAAGPAISLFGFSLAGLISGSLLVEVVCGWPGLGPLILDATLSRDFYLVIGGLIFSALFMIVGNLIADIMLVVADPRIRAGVPDAP